MGLGSRAVLRCAGDPAVAADGAGRANGAGASARVHPGAGGVAG